MLKFSKYAKAASTGRLSPESRDVKKKKLANLPVEKSSDSQSKPECNAVCKKLFFLKTFMKNLKNC